MYAKKFRLLVRARQGTTNESKGSTGINKCRVYMRAPCKFRGLMYSKIIEIIECLYKLRICGIYAKKYITLRAKPRKLGLASVNIHLPLSTPIVKLIQDTLQC